MANYNQGILGPFSGKVGPVVGSTWKGRQVMKGRPYPKKNITPSILQARVQQRMTVLAEYLRPLGGLISLGMRYVAKAAAVTPRNYATKTNMDNAMNLSQGVWSVIPSTIAISEGNYGNVDSVLLTQTQNGFNVTWTNNGGAYIGLTAKGHEIMLNDYDKVWIVLYNVEKKQTMIPVGGYQMRDDAAAVITRPSAWATGDHVHAYVFTMADVVYKYNTAPDTLTNAEISLAKEYIEQGYVFSGTANANITLT